MSFGIRRRFRCTKDVGANVEMIPGQSEWVKCLRWYFNVRVYLLRANLCNTEKTWDGDDKLQIFGRE